jgi:hypothetical protein
MQKVAFSLIELIIVVVLMGVISFLAIGTFSYKQHTSLEDLTQFRDIEVNLSNFCEQFVVYSYKKIEKSTYIRKNGIGESFILDCDGEIFLFKPFSIKKYNTLQEARSRLYGGFNSSGFDY